MPFAVTKLSHLVNGADFGNLAAAEAACHRRVSASSPPVSVGVAWFVVHVHHLARDRKDEFELHRAHGEAGGAESQPASA